MAANDMGQIEKRRELASLPQQLSKTQIAFLTQKTPREFVKQRRGPAGVVLDYVEVGYVIDLLNQAFGWDWDFSIENEQIGKNQVWVRGTLTVRMAEKVISKSQYGGAVIKKNKNTDTPVSIADDLKAAASDSLKKCASLLGVAGDVYWQNLDLEGGEK